MYGLAAKRPAFFNQGCNKGPVKGIVSSTARLGFGACACEPTRFDHDAAGEAAIDIHIRDGADEPGGLTGKRSGHGKWPGIRNLTVEFL
jgi:hypothetical protein